VDAKYYCESKGNMLARFDAPNETAELHKVLKNESAFIFTNTIY
jgi:hypothetical protein